MIDLRVATLPTTNGETIIIRLLDPDRVQPKLDGLGITRLTEWRNGVSRPEGLCLICGPTGSGKTTTLNASVKEMDRFGRAIHTVEDPVEYRIAYTNQVHINPAVGLDFSRAVRAFMRADPDVIILGEVRDTETARNAVKAAETGHLVVATLHTGSILGAVQRLRDLDVPAHELRHLIRSILVQRLIRVYCKECHGAGCPSCHNTGYAGRTVTSECAYFAGEAEVSALLEGKRNWPTMVEDALLKVDAGQTSLEEVRRVFGAEADGALVARGKRS
jgi:type II secretory ATPase GspE/PulE/Tfp pilus assembly ATPase PilB-like protein